MTETPTVVAVSGSLRDESTTRLALRHALDAAAAAGAETELLDLREFDLPLFDPDDRDRGDAAVLKRTVRDADAVLLGTPVYHGMVSSALKNALDYLGRDDCENVTFGLLATAGGGEYGQTFEHLRTGVRHVRGWTLPQEVGIRGAASEFDGDGEFRDPDIESRVRTLGRAAVANAFVEPRAD
ncbi:NADPH-dependent FMN reductase [Haloarcula litorea]|uniref:NADPH-dependent FMN reductase n=1 Tax=Haloarcula litorea TaxID=3032579 RepID=UPI0023E88D6A|nr:NAD(P)H-dependent oxidoreductase [Halomicroarcula sp. GDY20]